MTLSSDPQTRQRAHADKCSPVPNAAAGQAAKLVEKWKARLTELDCDGVAAKQARLWSDDHPEQGTEAG